MVCFFLVVSPYLAHQSLRATQSPGSLRINRMALCLISAFAGGHVGLIALIYAVPLCRFSTQQSSRWALRSRPGHQIRFVLHRYDHYWRRIVTPVMGFVSDAAGNIPTAD